MNHYYQNIEGFFDWEELYNEAIAQIPNNGVAVEVGLLKGKSFSYLCTEAVRQNKSIRIYGVDNFSSLMGWKWDCDVRETFTKNLEPHQGKYTLITEDSTKAAAFFSYNIIDFLFIDASHDYENVLADIKAWLPKMKPGSVVAGHDYTDEWEGLKKAVHEMFPDKTIETLNKCWRVKL